MFLGKVVGKVVVNKQHPLLKGAKYLLVVKIDESRQVISEPFIALDYTQATDGDIVFLVKGSEASMLWKDKFAPVDNSIVGIVDNLNNYGYR